MKTFKTLLFLFILNLFAYNLYGQCPPGMAANAGTVTVNDDGGTTIPNVVCFGSTPNISSNGDFVLPPGPNPGIMYGFYTCPPSDPNPSNDGCWTGWYWTGDPYAATNDGDLVPFGGQNTFWTAPIAADQVGANPNHDANSDDCVDVGLGQAVMFTYLNELIINESGLDECLGEVTLEIEGGYAELFGGSYSISYSGGRSFTQTGANGEIISITGLMDGDTYTLNVTDDGAGCTAFFSGGPINQEVLFPTVDYPSICYDGCGFPNFATPGGGTFSFTNPPGDAATIDPFTGEICNATNAAGYDVTYTVNGNCATFSEMTTVSVMAQLPAPMVASPLEFCEFDDTSISPIGIGDFYTLYEDEFSNNPLSTGSFFNMISFVMPGAGPVEFFVSQTVGACESARASFTVEIHSQSPPLGPFFYSACEGEPVLIMPESGHSNIPGEFNFYDDAALSVFLHSGDSYEVSPTSDITIYVTELNQGCETSPIEVNVIIDPAPTGFVGTYTCDPTNQFYSVVIATTDVADIDILTGSGMVTDNGDGTFTVSNVPESTALLLNLVGAAPTFCETELVVDAFECGCTPPAPPTDPTDFSICSGDTLPHISVSVPMGVYVNWYDAPANGNLLASDTTIYAPTAAGTYYAEAVAVLEDCVNDNRTPVTVIINPMPALVTVDTLCSADLLSYTAVFEFTDADTIQVSAGTVNGGNGNFTVANIPTGMDLTYSAFNADSTCILGPLVLESPSCPCPAVAPATTGPDQMICDGDPMPALSVTVGLIQTADWYDAATAGNALATNSLTYTPAAPGTYYVEARNTINNCVSTRDSITITSNPLPIFVLDNTSCAADLNSYSVTFSIANADMVVPTQGMLVDNGGNSFSITNIPTGVALDFTLNNTTTNCSDMFTITAPDCSCAPVNPPTSLGDSLICTGDVIPTFQVIVDAGQTVDWYDASVGGNLLLANSTSFTPTVAGTYFAEARVIADNCISNVRTAVSLTIETTPTLVFSDPSCALDLQTYSVDIQVDDAATLSIDGTGMISNNGNGSFTVTGIPTDENLVYTAFNASGNCSLGPITVIALDCPCPLINAPIVADTTICEGDPIPNLQLVVGMDETVDWYDAASGGTLLLSNSTSFTPATDGTFYLETRNTVNQCVSERDSITITTNPLPTITLNTANCAADLLTYDVSITVANIDGIVADVGTLVPDVNDDTHYDIIDIPAGTDLNIMLSNSLTGCELNELITAPDCSCPVIAAPVSAGNQMICSGEAIPNLSVTVEDGQIVNWYDAPVGGTLLLGDSNDFVPTMAGIFFAEAVVPEDGCTSASRTAVSLQINTQPVLVSESAICEPNLLSYTVNLQISGALTLDNDLGTQTNNGNGSFTISDIPPGMDLTYTAFNVDSTCTIGPAIVTAPDCSCPVIADPVPAVVTQSICSGDAIPDFMVSVGMNQTADWYDAPIGGNVELSNSLVFTPTDADVVYVEARDTINNCTSQRVEVSLMINPVPSFVLSQSSCAENLLTYEITVDVANVTIVNASLGGVTDNNDGTFTIAGIPAGQDVELALLNESTNCSFTAIVAAPDCSCPMVAAPQGLSDVAICTGDAMPVFEAIVDDGQTVNWYDAPVGGNQLATATTAFTPTAAGTFYAETIISVNGCISATRTEVSLVINENPSLSVSDFTLPTCNEEDGTIALTAMGGQEPYTYQLNMDGFQDSPFYTGLAASNYNLSVEDANGCLDSITQNLISPEDVFADAGEAMELTCLVTSVTLDGSNSDQGTNIEYQWLDPDGNLIPGAISNQLDVQLEGTYTLMVSNSVSECERTAEVVVTANNAMLEVEAGEPQNLTCDVETVNLVGLVEGGGVFEFLWMTTEGNIISDPAALSITADATGLYFLNVMDTETGCPGMDSVLVTELLPEDLDVTIEAVSPACLGDGNGSISVQDNNPDATLLFSLNDSPFTASTVYANLEPGNYTLHIQDVQGCLSDSIIAINQGTEVSLEIETDSLPGELFISLGDSVLLNAQTNLDPTDFEIIQWSGGNLLSCDTCLVTYTHDLQETTLFSLQLVDSLGCAASDDVRVFVDRTRHIFVPNAFSPNGDDSNEELTVFGGSDVLNIQSFRIFDRWGELVFEHTDFLPNDPGSGWNGKAANDQVLNGGVYVYVLEVLFVDGETETFAGDVILVK